MSPPISKQNIHPRRRTNQRRRTGPRVPRNQLTSAQRAALHSLLDANVPMTEAR